MSQKLYAERDTEAQGEFFAKHMDAMTREGLHGKFEIAAELAQLDMIIAKLNNEIVEMGKVIYNLTNILEEAGVDLDEEEG